MHEAFVNPATHRVGRAAKEAHLDAVRASWKSNPENRNFMKTKKTRWIGKSKWHGAIITLRVVRQRKLTLALGALGVLDALVRRPA